MIEDFTPEDAEDAVRHIVGHTDIPVPKDYQAKMAGFMLVIADVCKSNCPCDPCERTRMIFADM